ncbi:MAG: hypothetical protein J2P30_16625 [Actinobacteria bacterium]|nr:hypothetical protein [Actinomycetota bacterium]
MRKLLIGVIILAALLVTADRAVGSAMLGFGAVDHRLPGGFRPHPDGKNLSVSGKLAIGAARPREGQ